MQPKPTNFCFATKNSSGRTNLPNLKYEKWQTLKWSVSLSFLSICRSHECIWLTSKCGWVLHWCDTERTRLAWCTPSNSVKKNPFKYLRQIHYSFAFTINPLILFCIRNEYRNDKMNIECGTYKFRISISTFGCARVCVVCFCSFCCLLLLLPFWRISDIVNKYILLKHMAFVHAFLFFISENIPFELYNGMVFPKLIRLKKIPSEFPFRIFICKIYSHPSWRGKTLIRFTFCGYKSTNVCTPNKMSITWK